MIDTHHVKLAYISEKYNEGAHDRNLAIPAAFTWKPNRSTSEGESEFGTEEKLVRGNAGCIAQFKTGYVLLLLCELSTAFILVV